MSVAAKIAGSIGTLLRCVLNDFLTEEYLHLPDLWSLSYPPYFYGTFGLRVYMGCITYFLVGKKKAHHRTDFEADRWPETGDSFGGPNEGYFQTYKLQVLPMFATWAGYILRLKEFWPNVMTIKLDSCDSSNFKTLHLPTTSTRSQVVTYGSSCHQGQVSCMLSFLRVELSLGWCCHNGKLFW